MKLIYHTFFYFIFFSLLNSCNDISNYSDNSLRTPILKILSKEDSLAYLSYQDIDFGDVHWHRIPNLKVVFNNNSETDTVIIYSIHEKNNYGFKFYPEKVFPVLILPQKDNSDNKILIDWYTDEVSVGYFEDVVIINESKIIKLKIKGNIYY